MSRHFCIGYVFGTHGRGELVVSMSDNKFPSRKFLISGIVGNNPGLDPANISITNVFEFKNEKDFESFMDKEEITE